MGNSSSLISPCGDSIVCTTAFVFGEFGPGVTAVGDVRYGLFEGDPDVAGLGTIIAFFLPALSLLLCGFIVLLSLFKESIPEDANDPISKFLQKVPLPTPRPHHPLAGPPRPRRERHTTPPSPQSGHPTHPGFHQEIHRLDPPVVPQPWAGYMNHGHNSQHGFQYPPLPPTSAGPNEPTHSSGQITSEPTLNGSSRRDEHLWTPRHDKGVWTPSIEPEPKPKPDRPIKAWLYDLFEAALFCVPDSQVLMANALFAYFFIHGVCVMSHYHLQIGINLALIACSNHVLSLLLVRDYWKSPLAAACRIISAFFVFGALGLLFATRLQRGYTTEVSIEGPPQWRKTSLLLLSAGCFFEEMYEADLRSATATEDVRRLVGALNESPWLSYDFAFWAFLVVVTSVLLIFHLGLKVHKSRHKRRNGYEDEDEDDSNHTAPFPKQYLLLSLSILLALTVFVCLTIASTTRSRDWMSLSGWMTDDSEEERVDTFGQIAALVAMITVLIAMFDKVPQRTLKGILR